MDQEKIIQLYESYDKTVAGSARVAAVLQEALLRQYIKPQEKITELALSEMFHVSRTPIREALQKVEANGLVCTVPRVGLVARSWSIQDFIDIYEITAPLNALAARLTAKGNPSQVSVLQMRKLAESIRDAQISGRRTDFETYNYEFHMLIAQCSGNEHLVETLDRLLLRVRSIRPCVFPDVHHNLEAATAIYNEHMGIVDSILAGDAEAAAQISEAHIQRSRSSAIQWLAGKDPMETVY